MLCLDGFLSARSRWRGTAIPRSSGSPHILVIGACQGVAVARAMACLAPEASVRFLPTSETTRRRPTMRALLTELEHHDAVFSYSHPAPVRDDGMIEDLRARPNVTLVPSIAFCAYHPDLVHVGRRDPATPSGPIRGPMGVAHSALTLFGYIEGLSPEETLSLFRREVFERVGYFDLWDGAVRHLRGLGAQVGYDFDADLARWARRGCFMHSVDHVKLHVAADLARSLLDRAGIRHHAVELDAYLPDDLGVAGSWPVYPEIAQHYGVPGGALFQRPDWRRSGLSPTMTLRAFVEASFVAYARRPRTDLVCARVAAWRADRGLSADLLHAGIRGRSTTGK